MIFDVKQAIIDRLRATKRKNIERVIAYMEKNGFFSVGCHRHHTYRGGLASHAWQTYQIALRLYAEECAKKSNTPIIDEDSIAIVALLHDFCDCSGFREIENLHGLRSVVMLSELGFQLLADEYLAIRFHMDIEKKKNHPLYNDAKGSQFRYLIHKADGKSAATHKGYKDPEVSQKNLQPTLQNIEQLDCKNLIFQLRDGGWVFGLRVPYSGEIDSEWKEKIVGIKKIDRDKVHLCYINDSSTVAIHIIEEDDKKALFILHHYLEMGAGSYYSPDKGPFMYSEIRVYYNELGWNDYGYVACKQRNGWKLIKVIQFPTLSYEVIGVGFTSAEDAMKSIGIDVNKKCSRGNIGCFVI